MALDIFGDIGKIPEIYAWPDPVYAPKPVAIVFEIDGELSRKALDLSTSLDERQKYREIIGKQYAARAFTEATDHQRLAGWEIKKVVPGSLQKCDIQEDAEDILDRTKAAGKEIKGVPREKRIRALERDTAFWELTVIVVERQKMFSRYRETYGPDQGFEAIEKVPEWFGLKNETVDTKRN